MFIKLILSSLLLCFIDSCSGKGFTNIPKGITLTGDTIVVDVLGELRDNVLIVKKRVDLLGGSIFLPKDVTLDLRHGIVCNGCIVGNQTKLLCSNGVFDKVKIEGTWNVPMINSSYFSDLNYENSLQDVISLTNPDIINKVVVAPGDYYLSVDKNGGTGIILTSNTTLELNGTIYLVPNEHQISNIVLVNGNNITLRGDGRIIGDKKTHLGKAGEWGMGINLDKASHIRITGLTVKDCWGDCIYVGGESQYVLIDNCTLDNGRRQGISITSGKDVTIYRCKITNVFGTAPQYAIDVEPNEGDECDEIHIINVDIDQCKGGVLAFGRAENAYVGKIVIRNCNMKNLVYAPLRIEKCESLEAINNSIANFETEDYKLFKEIGTIIEKRNRTRKIK